MGGVKKKKNKKSIEIVFQLGLHQYVCWFLYWSHAQFLDYKILWHPPLNLLFKFTIRQICATIL